MADLQKTIEIIFGAKDDGVASVAGAIAGELGKIDGVVQGIADPFADFTKSLLKAEAGVALLAAAAIGFATNEAGQLKSSVTEIGTLFNAQPEQVEVMRQAILNYGRDSFFAFEDITQATYSMISATGDAEGAVDALAIAEQAAVVGSTGLNTAVNALTTVTNAYGLELTSSNDVLGAFIIAVQNGKTTLPELEASIGRVAATAAGSNVPFDDLLAAVAGLTAGGINTAESMTGLSAILKELASPTDELGAALGGVSLESDGLKGVMDKLKESTGGNFTAMNSLFGSIEATKTAMVLGNDAAGVFDKTLEQMGGKTEVLSQNFELMAGNADLAMQNLVNNIKGTLVNIGTPLLDEFGSSAGALADIFKTLGIEVESGALKPLEDALESFAGNASDLLQGIATALPDALGQVDFSSIIASFEDLGGVFDDVFGQIFGEDLDLTKPEDLANALQTAVNIAESFVNITGEIIQEFSPIFEALGEAGKQMGDTSTETDAAIGKFLGAMTLLSEFGTAMGALAIVVNETGTDVDRVFDLLGGSAKTAVNVIQAAFDLIVATVAGSGAVIATAFEKLTPDIIGDPWGGIAEDLRELEDAAGQNFARNMSEAGDGIKQVSDAFTTIEEPAKKASSGIVIAKEKTVELATSLSDFGLVLDPVTGGLIKIGESSKDAAGGIDILNASAAEMSNIKTPELSASELRDEFNEAAIAVRIFTDETYKFPDSSVKAGAAIKSLSNSTSELSKSQQQAIQNTLAMETTLLELASNEKISAMKFTADIEVAKIEGQAKQVAAAFESIGVSVTATSEAVASLWDTYAEKATQSGSDEIEAAALRQESREQQALNNQERLINQQISYMQAQVDALYKESVVRIESSGLEKDIEAFMFEILKRIQLKVSGDRSAFLLGLG